MAVPQTVKLARLGGDLDDDGHDPAANVTFDPATSGLAATNVQDAIDEVVASGVISGFVGCKATRTTDQTLVATATATPVDFTGTDDFDTAAMHDPGSNPSRSTVPTGGAGKWLATASVIWDSNTVGVRQMTFRVNGTTDGFGFSHISATGGFNANSSSTVLDLVDGDYVEVIMRQDSGSNRTLTGSLVRMEFSLVKLDI